MKALAFGSLHEFLTLCYGILNGADVKERLFWQVVHLTVENHVEALYCILYWHHYSRYASKLLCHGEWLREETLHTTCSVNGKFIFIRQLVHTEDGDDVLQFLVTLQYLLHTLSAVVVFLAHNERVEDSAGRTQWVYGRIDTKLRNLTAKFCSGIEVGEGGGRSRVGQVVCRNVNGLH